MATQTLDDILAENSDAGGSDDEITTCSRHGASSRGSREADAGAGAGEERTFNFGGGLDMLLNQDAKSKASALDDEERPSARAMSDEFDEAPPTPMRQHAAAPKSYEDVQKEKQDLLFKLDRFRRAGVFVTRKYNMTSNIEDLRHEYEKLKHQREIEKSIKFQRDAFMSVTSGIEFVNGRFLRGFGFKLDGWSQSQMENLDDYDEVFEELHEKYNSQISMPPELKLLMMVGSSAFMFHMTNVMFKDAPGLKDVLKQNPDLAKQFAQATMNTMANNPLSPAPTRGPANMAPERDYDELRQVMESRSQAATMRGPDGVDELLAELQRDREGGHETTGRSAVIEPSDDGHSTGSSKKQRRPKKKRQTLRL